ncbi:restriction endonuclease subunit S [Bacillus infantis]|uniref:restriction endonuclease subunit S n=1 Tax=Bacillus infantis TaxID=324767 RepID=UPI001CD4A91E|nr:restriction endonuclease subunit S [Bacillus infantis]MCA1042038.1 restriction endonuclease subunit S [Bacillus infantis]
MMIVEKRTVHNGYKMTELGEIPVEWEVSNLGSMTEIIMGQSPSSSSYNDQGDGLPFYQGKTEFGSKYPQVRKWCNEPTKIAEANDVLISVRAPVGAVNMCRETSCIGRGLGAIRAINGKSIPWFLYYTLQNAKTRFESLGQGSTFTAINGGELRNLFIMSPPLKEQERIAEILFAVDEQIENTQQLIEKTKELKKGLMQQLLTKGIGHTEFKMTELGEIPVGWEVANFFKHINTILDFRGRTPKKLGLEWGKGSIAALSANNVKMGYIDFSAECYLGSLELYDRWMTKGDLSKGDILMTMEAPLGNVAQVPDNNKYILSQRVIAFKTDEDLYNDYFKHFLMSPFFQSVLDKNATGTTAKGISQKNLSQLDVLIPPLKEQQKIAEILSSVDEHINSYQKEKVKYIELKKGLLQQLLTGKIRVKL